jgi:hypothetical protein
MRLQIIAFASVVGQGTDDGNLPTAAEKVMKELHLWGVNHRKKMFGK